MNLDDYVKKVEEAKKYERPRWALYYKDIDSYNLPKEKVDLIKEYYKYIISIPFDNIVDDSSLNNGKKRNYFILQQTETQTGNRMVVLIDMVDIDIDGRITIKPEEKTRRMNYFKKVGNQQFGYTSLLSDYDISDIIKRKTTYFNGYHFCGYIFYSLDNYVFISDELAEAIRIIDVNRIGNILAEQVYKLKEEEKQKQKQKQKEKDFLY